MNHADADVTGRLDGRLEGMIFSREVTLRPHETKKVEFTPETHPQLILPQPRVWWTHDLGRPELYTLSLSFNIKGAKPVPEPAPETPPAKPGEKPEAKPEGKPQFRPGMGMPRVLPSDMRTVRFGVREIADYRTEDGHRGFKLNGRKILIRGGGWADNLLLDNDPKRLRAEVLYARHMNLNALRLEGFWGTGRAFYNLCDENGILVMVGWSCHWEWENYLGRPADEPYGGIVTPELIDLVAESWRHQVLWLRNHPSIFVWAEASDMVPHPDLERRYIEIMKEIDPTRPTLVSAKDKTSEITGPSGVKMRGPYDYVPPVYWYVDTKNGGAFGFNTETGPGPQVPPLESLRKMLPEDKLWPINDHWSFHCCRGKFKDPRPLQRGHGPAARPPDGPRGLPAQGPVPELRRHAGHVRGLHRQEAQGHGRHPVDVQLGLAQAVVAALRLFPPADRGLLRRPQGRRARPPHLRLRQPGDRRGQQLVDGRTPSSRPPSASSTSPSRRSSGRRSTSASSPTRSRRSTSSSRPPA